MAIEASAKIVLRGGPESLKVLQGIRRETSAAGKEAKAAAATQVAAAKKAAEEQRKAMERAARAAEKSQKDIEKTALKEAAYWQKLAVQSANVRIKEQIRVTRAAEREAAQQVQLAKKTAASQAQDRRAAVRRMGGAIGAGAAGVLAGATVAAGTARGIAGVKDVRERITSANEFRERLVLATNAAGMSASDREGVQSQVLATSTSTGQDIGELMSVLETGQAQFNNLKFFADNLKEIAVISKAAGADTGELATALGYVQQAFGLSGDEAMEAAYLMKASADKGSVELANFAKDFAASAGMFANNTGQKGLGGVRQFLGASQAVATGGFGSAESATRLDRLITDLNDVEVQKGLKGIGVKNVMGKDGKIDIGNILTQLGSNKEFAKASTRQDIFKEVRGREGIESLLAAQSRVNAGVTGAVDFKSIAGVDAQAGREATASGFASMQGEGFFKMQQEAAKMQADTVENLGAYNSQILKVAETSNQLEKAFGSLSLWANSIAAAGLVGGGVSMVSKLAGGAGAAAGGGALAKAVPSLARAGGAVGGAGAGLLAAGSTAVGAASGMAIAGTIAAGAAVGYGAGTLINEASGWASSDDKRISDRLADSLFELVHGNRELVQATKETNRKLGAVEQATRMNAPKGGAEPGKRGPR
jgi:hypothetical protein